MDQAEMTLRDLTSVVMRRKWLVITAVVFAVAVAVAFSILQTPIYSASARVLVEPRGEDGLFESRVTNLNDRTIQTEIQVIEGDAVRERVQADLGLDQRPPEVSASSVGDTDVVSLAVRDANPQNAQTYANAYAVAYIDIRREQAVTQLLAASAEVQLAIDDLQAQIDALPEDDPRRNALVTQLANFNTTLDELRVDAALRTGGAAIIRPAELPTDPVEPTPVRTSAIAIIAGLFIGLGASFLLEYFDRKIRDEDQLAAVGGHPVLAVVPVDPPPDHRPIAISHPSHVAVEAYRGLRTNLAFLGLDQTIKVIQVTSSLAGEGKTTASANLAVVLAQAGHRVAVVDADLRRPRLHEVFAVRQTPGFIELLLGEEAKHAVQSVPVTGGSISVYASGSVPSNPSEMLSGRRVRHLLKEMGGFFDYVIVDSAPALPVSDAIALAGAVDGVLVVVQSGRVTADEVTECVERLDRISAPVLGFVLNRVSNSSMAGYTYGGYTSPKDRKPVVKESADDTEPLSSAT